MRRARDVTSAAIMAGALFLAVPAAAEPDRTSAPPPASAPVPAHLACMRALQATAKLESTAAEAIRRDDLDGLTRLYEDVDSRLRAARIDMDRAFLTGAWQAPSARRQAAELLGQMEAVQMLNFIGLAFLKGYEHPTHKVSLSIHDANDKMFMQLSQLLAALDAFNSASPGRAGAAGH
jgi:hypothetical protein